MTDVKRPRWERLAADLERVQPADEVEAGHLARCLSLARQGAETLERGHFDPGHFTASAFVLSPDEASLLLIFHGKLHRWLQPGGHVDASDPSVEAAARREVAEETGLDELTRVGDGVFDVDVHEIPSLRGEPAHLHHDVRYLFVARDTSAVAGSDAQDARWVPLDEVGDVESDESVLRAVRKLRTTRAGTPSS